MLAAAAVLVACNSADVLVPPSPIPSASTPPAPIASVQVAPQTFQPLGPAMAPPLHSPSVAAVPSHARPDTIYGAVTPGVQALNGSMGNGNVGNGGTPDIAISPASPHAASSLIAAPGAIAPPPLGQPAPAGGLGPRGNLVSIIEPSPLGVPSASPPSASPSSGFAIPSPGGAVLNGQTPPGALIARPATPPAAPRGDRLSRLPVEQAPALRAPVQQAPVQQAFVTPRQMEPPVLPRKPEATPPTLSKAERQCRKELKRLKVEFAPVKTVRGKMGCGIAHPLKVTKLSKRISMKPAAVMNCQAALASARWAHREVAPAARRRYASNVDAIHHMSAYSCRRIRGSGRLSEHGKGNALDVGAITLKNGRTIKVAKKGFFSVREKSFLKAIRKGACEHFTTVLGPGYNRDHADHFHFDMKQRRGGRRFCNM